MSVGWVAKERGGASPSGSGWSETDLEVEADCALYGAARVDDG